MAADSYGPKKQPQFSGSGVPQTAADLTTLGEYAALVGNRKTGTTTERQQALSNGEVWEGLIWGDTTDGNDYRCTSNAWVLLLTQVRASGTQGGQKNAGIGAGSTYNFESATFTIPSGRSATVRASLYCLVGRQDTTGRGAGRMSLIVNGSARPELTSFNTQSSGTNVPITLAQWIAFQMTGTGQPFQMNARINTDSSSAACTVWDYRHNFSIEY